MNIRSAVRWMASITKKNKYTELLQFVKVYLIIFLVAIVIGNYLYYVVKKDTLALVEENKGLILAQNESYFTTEVASLYKLKFDLLNSYHVMALGDIADIHTPEVIVQQIKAREQVKDSLYALNSDSIVLDSLVYYRQSDYIISSTMIEEKTEYFSAFCQYNTTVMRTLNAFFASGGNNLVLPSTPIVFEKQNKNVITVVSCIQAVQGREVYSLILLDVDEIFAHMEASMQEGSCFTFAMGDSLLLCLQKAEHDPKGYIVLPTVSATDHIVIHRSNEMVRLSFYEPTDKFYQSTASLDRLFQVMLSAYLLFGGVGVGWLVCKNLKQVSDLLDALKVNSIGEGKENASKLIQNNAHLTSFAQAAVQYQTLSSGLAHAPKEGERLPLHKGLARDIQGSADALYYPAEIEQKLINGTCGGDTDGVCALLEQVQVQNRDHRQLMGYFMKGLKYQQMGTLGKIMAKLPQLAKKQRDALEKDMAQMVQLLNTNEYVDVQDAVETQLCACYQLLCEASQQKKAEKDLQGKAEILQYLDAHITDPDLSTMKVQEVFGISRSHLFKVMRTLTNQNFSNYVEERRLQIAKEQLKESNAPVYAIAEQVGYYSTSTFCRAYKRRYGISPNQERGG